VTKDAVRDEVGADRVLSLLRGRDGERRRGHFGVGLEAAFWFDGLAAQSPQFMQLEELLVGAVRGSRLGRGGTTRSEDRLIAVLAPHTTGICNGLQVFVMIG
jgi:hypothetical protein